jgi:hypothetical protein
LIPSKFNTTTAAEAGAASHANAKPPIRDRAKGFMCLSILRGATTVISAETCIDQPAAENQQAACQNEMYNEIKGMLRADTSCCSCAVKNPDSQKRALDPGYSSAVVNFRGWAGACSRGPEFRSPIHSAYASQMWRNLRCRSPDVRRRPPRTSGLPPGIAYRMMARGKDQRSRSGNERQEQGLFEL